MANSNLKQMMNQWLNGRNTMKSETIFKRIFTMLRVLMMVVLFAASTAHAAISNIKLTVVADGVAPFDATDGAGLDSSASNGIVRTFDRITYRVEYSSDSTASSKFVFTLPAGATWDSTSTASSLCTGTGGGTISGVTLTCNRIPTVGVEAFNIYAYAKNLANGSTLTPSVAADGGASVLGQSLTISAVPKASTRTYNNNLIPSVTNGVSGYQHDINFGIGVNGTSANLIGAESLASPFTYQISVMPGAYLISSCSVCSQPGGPGTPIIVTRSTNLNFDATGNLGFFSPAFNSAYFLTFKIFTPIDPNNTPNDTSDDNFPLGSVSYLTNQISGFDPQGISGQSNFGTGYSEQMDPSYVCGKTSAIINAYACSSLKIDRTKTVPSIVPVFSVVSEQGGFNDVIYGDSNAANNQDNAYSESVLPGQTFEAYAGLYSEISGFGTASNVGQCFLFDNSLISLTGEPTVRYGNNVVSVQTATTVLTGSDVVVEYISQPLASDAVRKSTNCGVAGDGASGWSTDASAVGGFSAVTAIRYKYTKPLNVSAGLTLGVPLKRTTDSTSLSLADGTVIPWFWHNNYITDPDSVVHYDYSNYSAGTGPAQRGGRITAQPIKVRQTTVVGSASIAPSTQTTVTITPRVIGAAVAGVDGVAKNVVVTAKFQDNCVVPVESSLPSNATYTAGNYGADGIPCTADDGAAGSVSFALGDVTVAGGTAVAPYGGATATLTPITFSALAVPTASTSTKTLTTTISSTNDLTLTFISSDYAEDRTEITNVVINGAASFSAAKTTTGVTGGKVGPNEIFGYTISFGNGGSTNSGVGYFVDVLPFDGDDNGTTGLGAGKFEITSLAASMSTSAMGTVTIQYSTDASATVQAAIKVAGQEDGNTGINWTTYTTGATIPAGITAIRFVTSNPMLIGYSGSGTINLKAPTINSTTSFTNTVWARTDLYQGDPASAQVIRSGSAVTIQGLDPSTLRGRVFLDANANGTYDAGESGLTSTIVKIQCTAGACLTAPQGTVFSMVVDAAGGYAFAPNATGIFASADGSGTALSAFQGVLSGTWTVTETPPSTPSTAISTTSVGTINGTTSGTASGRSITDVAMVSSGIGINYNFAERFLDGTIEVTKALTLPTGITGPLSFDFTATCDLPVANTKKSATLSNYPTNTTVSITGIAAGATCTIEETLPASPDTKYYWETPVFSALSPSTMPNGGTQSVTVTNKLSPTVTIAKAVTSAPTAVTGKPTQFDTTYRLTVSNVSSAAQTYDLTDTFGFDSDVTVVGTPTIVKSSNVSGTVSSAFTGTGTNTSIITGESIAAGSTATPTTETYDVTVRVNVPAGSSTSNDTCSGTTSGQGLFNTGVLSMSGASDQTATACSNTPAVSASSLVLTKTWVNANVGERVNIPATTGFSVNTAAFDAAATGSNSVSSTAVTVAPGETGTLPTEVYATPANSVNYTTTGWSCSDGVNPAATVAQGGSLSIPSGNAGLTMTCTLTNTNVVDGVAITKSVLSGPDSVQGLTDQFDITYQIKVSNSNASDTVYSVTDLFGFESDVSVVGTPTVTKSANVSGAVNSGFTGSGANAQIISNEAIAAGSVTTPTEETYDVKVRLQVQVSGSSANNSCNSLTGNGLFNTATLEVSGTSKIADACAQTPTVPSAQLKLQVDWIGALVGEAVSVPATTGLSTNTNAFNATSTGTNSVSSNDVTVLIGSSAILPTPSFVTPNNALNYVSSASWTCSDGVNADKTIAFGGSLPLSNAYSGTNLVCKVTYSGVQVDTVKTASPASGTAVAIGDTITYTLKTTVAGSATQRDVVLTDTLGAGLTVGTLPAGCSVLGQKLTCTLAAGAAVGEHTFTYDALVNSVASQSVSNQVTADVGTCSSCTVINPLWNVITKKTTDLGDKKGVRIGDTITYTISSTIVGGASTRQIVMKDTLGVGLTLTSTPAGCTSLGQSLSCTVPTGSAAGVYAFTYTAVVNAQAQNSVTNTVVSTEPGSCTGTNCQPVIPVIRDVSLLVTKTAKTKTAKIGDFVRYEVVVENADKYDADNFQVIDQPAPGLSYVSGSMQVTGDDSFTVTSEYPLVTSGLNVAVGQKITLTYMMRVGAGAGQGALKNCARAADATQAVSSNQSCAEITRTSDPDFEDTRIFGTVFEDLNANGMQDDGEPGIPGVRLATVEGLLIETDAYGRYHIEGINPGQWARGSNFIVKVDVSTLPEGSVPTTQNPLVKRLTQGLPGLFNFGFKVPFTTYEPGKLVSYPLMLSADGLFDFDRFDLLATGREKLTALAQQLKEDERAQKGLTVKGYTDRLGSDAYNQKLSLKRAETIKAFLVSQGIAENLISIEGLGGTQPLVQCPGPKSDKVIQCLAPNRRFEVTLQ